MDPKLKTVLAVLAGVVIGVTLLGSAFAIPAVFRAAAFHGNARDGGYGMMGGRGFQNAPGDGYGMMGPRGQSPRSDDGTCQNGAASGDGYGMRGPRGGCGEGYGMMGPRGGQSGPGDGTGTCPNGAACPDSGTCPNVQDAPANES